MTTRSRNEGQEKDTGGESGRADHVKERNAELLHARVDFLARGDLGLVDDGVEGHVGRTLGSNPGVKLGNGEERVQDLGLSVVLLSVVQALRELRLGLLIRGPVRRCERRLVGETGATGAQVN